MSWALVKRAQELLDEDLTKSSKPYKEANTSAKSVDVSTNRHGIKKAAKQKKRAQQRKKEAKKQFIEKQVASAIDEYKKYAHRDHTDKNIKLLKRIDKMKTPSQYIEQISNHHIKELERKLPCRDHRQHQKGKKHAAKEASVFSDEDFEKMNEEWLRLY
ncbi:uncharacterized protein [Panulirus ornatus]|uniref:uncharacterized protein isoform X3 n=1 Tax=Panulirus ornatus TaxID=150431 RepID=UPI003A85F15D